MDGKRVFCSDMTFAATLNPVVYEGGIPVFIDAEYETWDMVLLEDVVSKLCRGEKLEGKEEHPLSGRWNGCRDCHIRGDWVLIYRIEDQYLILRRTGSHSDVF